MKKLFFLIAVFSLTACTETVKNYVVKVKLRQLTEPDLFDKNKVHDVIFDAEELDIDSLKNQSRKYFLEGIDLYRNKKEPSKAIDLFKKSILTFPDPKTYYEYGNALIDAKQGTEGYLNAVKAFDVAEHLQFQPVSMIQYGTACAYYCMGMNEAISQPERNNYMNHAVYSLKSAFENGFTDTTMLSKDERINDIIQADNYKIMLAQVKPNSFNSNATLFNAFINSFPQKAESFEITPEQVEMKGYNLSISYSFAQFVPEMENVSFGRDVSHDFFYVARVAENQNYVAVLYSSINFYGEMMQPVSTQLVTYSPEGKIIAGRLFACNCSAEKIKTGKIDNGIITVSDYTRTWEQPIDQVPFEENRIEKTELVSSSSFKINDDGTITEGTAYRPYKTAPYTLAEIK